MASGFASPVLHVQGRRHREARLRPALLDRPAGEGPDADARGGGRAKVPMPGLAAIREVFQAARAQGFGQEDIAAVVKADGGRRGRAVRHPQLTARVRGTAPHRGAWCPMELLDWSWRPWPWSAVMVAVPVAPCAVARPRRAARRRGRARPGPAPSELGRLLPAQDELRQDVHRGREASVLQLSRRRAGTPRRAGPGAARAGRGEGARAGPRAPDGAGRGQPAPAGGGGGRLLHARRRRREHPGPRSGPAPARPARDATSPSATRSSSTRCACPAAATSPSTASGRAWRGSSASTRPTSRSSAGASSSRSRATCAGASATWASTSTPSARSASGLLAVPDAVYAAAPEAHGEGYREGVLVVPYSLALPYVLALYRLTVRFGCAVDTDQLAARLRGLDESLRQIDEEVEGRLSRGARAGRQRARRAARPRGRGAAGRARSCCSPRSRSRRPRSARPSRGPIGLPSVFRASVAEVD